MNIMHNRGSFTYVLLFDIFLFAEIFSMLQKGFLKIRRIKHVSIRTHMGPIFSFREAFGMDVSNHILRFSFHQITRTVRIVGPQKLMQHLNIYALSPADISHRRIFASANNRNASSVVFMNITHSFDRKQHVPQIQHGNSHLSECHSQGCQLRVRRGIGNR